MHCIFSGQYQINAFVLEILKHGITCEHLDGFPRGHKLCRDFFATRIVRKNESHIKAFASECIDAVVVLSLFIDLVVEPAGTIPEHVRCFRLLEDIVKILFKPDDIMLNVDTLEETMRNHQERYNGLGYKQIPTNHYTRHIVDCVRRFQLMISCFSPERDHKNSKNIAKLVK